MDIVTAVLQRLYNSGELGAGTRSVNGTITATRTAGTPDVIVTTITISAITAMTEAELTDYQTFVNLLDEEATLTAALVALDDATP
jgi:hypothetical protein